MQALIQDVRYTLRQLIKSPGFALTAVVSLALGIGATTAVFSVIYAVLMNPFPYRAAERLVRLSILDRAGRVTPFVPTGAEIGPLRKVNAIEKVLVLGGGYMTMTGRDLPVNVRACAVSAATFADLGVPPILGRGIAPADAPEAQEPQPVVVLSYEFWRRQFLSDPDVVGKTLQLDRKMYTVIGVAAPRFKWARGDVYLPLEPFRDPRQTYGVNLRLKPGVSFAAADAELQPLLDEFARAAPRRFPEHFRVRVEGLNDWVVRQIGGTLYLLFAAVGLLLAIGCSNVSILLLARGAAREHELAVRAAVGAGRSRIVRQLLTESMVLAAVGVVLGVWMAYGLLAVIRTLVSQYAFAPEVAIGINIPVLLFSAAVAVATGIVFGLWPALRLSLADVGGMMQSNTRRVAGSVRGRRSHNTLIAAQITLTLLLLSGAGSAIEGFLRLLHTPLGYDPHNALCLEIPVHEQSYPTWAARAAYFERLRAKVAETPGVTLTAMANANATPPENGWYDRFEILGHADAQEQRASVNLVGASYFAVLRIPMVQGRIWSETETANGAHVAVINRTMARRYFPNGDAIGRSVKLPDLGAHPWREVVAPNSRDAWMEIVGIVGDARNDGLDRPVTPAVYVPYTLSMTGVTQILVRASIPPMTLLHALRAQVAAVDPEQQVYGEIYDLDAWISIKPEWQQEHLTAWIFGLFAGLALALAAVGLFSVVSYTVTQRANEFGIRMALGARPADVIRIVFTSTALSVGGGMAAGLAATAAVNRMIGQWIKGGSRDPMILIGGAVLLGVVAAVACAVPAWRASRADPMETLRCP